MTTLDLYDTDATAKTNPAILAGLRRLWTSYNRKRAERRADRKMVLALNQLDDRMLRDIGIEPQDVIAALQGRQAPSILFDPMRRRPDHE